MEKWFPIKDFENYLISNTGKVMNSNTGKLLYINDKGGKYYSVDLWKNNNRHNVYTHLKNGKPYKNVVFSKEIKPDWKRDIGGKE